MNDYIYRPPEANVESEHSSEKSFVENVWHKLNRIWFFTTTFGFVVLGVLTSIPFKESFSTAAIYLLTSILFMVSGLWWVVHDQTERDTDFPSLLMIGMVFIPILAYPFYCYWSRGLLYGSIQLLKMVIYIAICLGLNIGTIITINQVVA